MIRKHFSGGTVSHSTARLYHHLLLMLNFLSGIEFFTINHHRVNTSESIHIKQIISMGSFLKGGSPTPVFASIDEMLNGPWLREAAFQGKGVLKRSVLVKVLKVIFGVA